MDMAVALRVLKKTNIKHKKSKNLMTKMILLVIVYHDDDYWEFQILPKPFKISKKR